MPFLTAYMSINYAYFAMAMSYDVKLKQTTRVESRLKKNGGRCKENGTTADTKKKTIQNGIGNHSNNTFSYGTLNNESTFEDGELDVSIKDNVVSSPKAGSEQKGISVDGSISFEVNEPPVFNANDGDTEKVEPSADEELNVESNHVTAENIGEI